MSTKFVLVAAATFMVGTAMAQTDTTKAPVPDTTQVPPPPPPPSEPKDTTSAPKDEALTKVHSNNSLSLAFNQATAFYATDQTLVNTKQYDLRTEEETEA